MQMDQIHSRRVLDRGLRALNQKVERDLQQKLSMLDKQYRFTRKMLQQRRDSLIQEHSRVVIVKVCEPKATVNIAMKEIGEHKSAGTHSSGVHTSGGRRLCSRKSPNVEPSRSISAPPSTAKPTSPARHTGNVQGNVSLMRMKNIAAIDSISEKELARQQQKAREEVERAKQLQRETLHKRVTAFVEGLKRKGNVELLEPPQRNSKVLNATLSSSHSSAPQHLQH